MSLEPILKTQPGIHPEASVHPTAIVHPNSYIAKGAKIGPWTEVGPDVYIGEDTQIASHVVIRKHTRIGKSNTIFQFSTIGEDTPDLKYKGEPTRLVIGDSNTIREGVTIHRGTVQDQGTTVVGSHNLFMAYVHIGHDCQVGSHIIMANNASLAGHVVMGDWVITSGYVLVHQRCRVGAHSFCGMAAGISMDVPAFVTVTGAPASARSINVEGLKRRDFAKEDISNLMKAYKIVYRRSLKIDEAISAIRTEIPSSSAVDLFVSSLESSTRGITR